MTGPDLNAQSPAVAIESVEVVHHGLLLVYRDNDPTRDLRAADIAARVAAIVQAYPDGLQSLVLVVNKFGAA